MADTHVASAEIRSEFGDDVANIADATSFDETIDDHLDIDGRCFEVGRGAVMVKAADILDNSDYYELSGSAELRKTLRKKLDSFIRYSEQYMRAEDRHQELDATPPIVNERMNIEPDN
ncbi:MULTISPECIES: hypothetical protein [Halobacterium]|uniref:hypothetical protein n=1 Tax=Halobacterium TaxID=2239 RepID=UPI001E3F6FA9|nr:MULTISPECIES: hypothetical protein [Halobacterium]MDL0121626.1 hypothetical protein [Halobacterium salinarum]UDF60556.1 hypothetical protein JRZ79_03230 [Halobacterium sp. BOL4-2]